MNSIDIDDPARPFQKNSLDFKDQKRRLSSNSAPISCTQQNGRKRSFYKEWYDDHDCLEYSPSLDLTFCFSCSSFKGNEINSSRTDETFSKNGFKGWYRANKFFFKS